MKVGAGEALANVSVPSTPLPIVKPTKETAVPFGGVAVTDGVAIGVVLGVAIGVAVALGGGAVEMGPAPAPTPTPDPPPPLHATSAKTDRTSFENAGKR